MGGDIEVEEEERRGQLEVTMDGLRAHSPDSAAVVVAVAVAVAVAVVVAVAVAVAVAVDVIVDTDDDNLGVVIVAGRARNEGQQSDRKVVIQREVREGKHRTVLFDTIKY